MRQVWIKLSGIALVLVWAVSIPFQFIRPDPADPIPETTVPVSDTSPVQLAVQAFDRFLEARLDSSHTVGAAATIVHGDEIVYTRSFGVKRAGTREPVTHHTVFRLASVSKGFTGVLTLLLEEEGLLSTGDRVIKYVSELRLKDSVNTADLNLHHLLNHTSGLVPHAYDNLAEAGQKIHMIIPQLETVNISGPPGEIYGYQNVLFSLMDTITAMTTGKDFPLALREKLFLPLGMNDASAGFDSLVWHSDVAFPHIRRAGRYRVLPMHTGYYNLTPAAGVNASISDMGQWLKALLGNDPGILGGELLQKISTPQIQTPLKRAYTRHWDPIEGRYYSFGWRIFDYKGRRIIYHGGYVRGYRAEIAFCPSEGTGLAFLQNSPNRLASQCVPIFFNLLFAELDKAPAE